MKQALILTLGICAIGLSTPTYAQSFGHNTGHFNNSVQAQIGLKIPFGGDYKKANAKPQLALGLRSEASHHHLRDWALGANTPPPDTREFELALTLEPTPSFLLNDQVLSLGDKDTDPDGTLNAMDTYDKTILTVIGVSLAVIAGSIIIVSVD